MNSSQILEFARLFLATETIPTQDLIPFDLPIRNDAGFRPFTKLIINKSTSKKLNDFILLNNIFHNKKKNAVLTAKSLA